MQNLEVIDSRDALRVRWLTFSNLRNNYIRWEEVCVKEGFARMPHNERERQAKGHIVFFEGKDMQVANLDEMSLTLNGTDERAGGRPGVTPTTNEFSEGGKVADKSSNTCTVTFGVIGNEPIPFLVI